MKTKEEIEAHRRTCEHFNTTLLGDGRTCCTADLRALPTWQDPGGDGMVYPCGDDCPFMKQFINEDKDEDTFVSLFSLLVVFLLLYNQFRSVSQSAVILLNLPLALIGGVFILRFTTGEISIPAIIGFISLFGIATRNGMLLVSHYNTMLSEGNSLHDTILRGSLDRLNFC